MDAIKHNLSYPITILILLLASSFYASSQKRHNFDRKKQLIIGIKGGVNFTQPLVLSSHSVFSPTLGSLHGSTPKKYEPFMKNMGFNGGIFLMYRITNRLSASLEGLYFQYRYSYKNSYVWTDAVDGTTFTLEQQQFNRLNYFEIPVMLRYDFTIRKITPFIQGGIFTGFMHSAVTQSVSRQYSSQIAPSEETKNPLTQTNDRYTKVHLGAVGGGGVSFFAGKIMLTLGGNVRYSLLPPTGNLHRYNDQASSSSAYLDVPDNMNFLNMELYVSIGVPVSFGGNSQPKFGTNYCSFGK